MLHKLALENTDTLQLYLHDLHNSIQSACMLLCSTVTRRLKCKQVPNATRQEDNDCSNVARGPKPMVSTFVNRHQWQAALLCSSGREHLEWQPLTQPSP